MAVPVTAMPLFGQTAVPPGHSEAPPATGEKVAAPQSPSTAAVPPAPKSIEQRESFGFPNPSIPATVPDAVATTQGHFLDIDEMATLRKLGDILLPPLNGYPGSTQACAPEFLDFLLSVSPAERQDVYRFGLDRLNAEAHKHFSIPFAQVNAEQADTLLRPWLRTWMVDHPPTEPFARFVNVAHQDIRTATMNSQAWSIAATTQGERAPGVDWYWSPIDPDIQMYV